jgi:hypothetical protein
MKQGSAIAPPAGAPWRAGSMETARFMVPTMDLATMAIRPAAIAGPFSAHGPGDPKYAAARLGSDRQIFRLRCA